MLVALEDRYGIRLLDVQASPGRVPVLEPADAATVTGTTGPPAGAAEASAPAGAQAAPSALRLFYERVCGSDARLRVGTGERRDGGGGGAKTWQDGGGQGLRLVGSCLPRRGDAASRASPGKWGEGVISSVVLGGSLYGE
jgi:hypothetical protein